MKYPANELWNNRIPICPYCMKEQSGDDLPNQGDDVEQICESCEKKFYIQVNCTIEYATKGSCELNGEMPHTLKKSWAESAPLTCTKCRGDVYDWELEGGKYQHYTKEQYVILEPPTESGEI